MATLKLGKPGMRLADFASERVYLSLIRTLAHRFMSQMLLQMPKLVHHRKALADKVLTYLYHFQLLTIG